MMAVCCYFSFFCNIQCQSIIVVLENMLTAVVGYASVESEDMSSPTFFADTVGS